MAPTLKALLSLVAGLVLAAAVAVAQEPLPTPPYTVVKEPGYCAWYGECGFTAVGPERKPLNCPFNGPAIPVTNSTDAEEFRATLVDFCGPKWTEDLVPATCCSYPQLQTLIDSLSSARQFVYNCPACWNNFLELFCHLTCSPDGSTFINVTNVIRDPVNPAGDPVIDGVNVFIDPYFGERFYSSCANVTFSQSNAPAMLFIGGGAENYLEFLNFLGKKQPLGSPFDLLFPGEESFEPVYTPWNGTVANCFDNSTNRCSCVDCPTVCPALLPAEAAAEVCYVGAMRCLSFALLVAFGAAFLVIVGALLVLNRRTAGYVVLSESSPGSINDTSSTPKNWFVYTWLQKRYYSMGLWVARHPGTVILCSFVVVAGFSAGLIKFQVETDPVALWSAATSTTRVQKDYFDTTFGPFYRTQQVILSTPDGVSSIVNYANIKTVFDLLGNISNIAVVDDFGNNVTFYDDLCFRPLDLNGDVQDCVIQSIAGYWQNSLATLELDRCMRATPGPCNAQNDSYVIEHYRECTANPAYTGSTAYPLSCLPPFQDPIKPEVALGGYDGNDFLNARAFIVTFLINNSLNQTYLDAAYKWELAMVDYMETAVAAHPELRITYYTESGVEIELARESASDLVTVAISYVVMLLYVSIALGRFSSVRRLFIDTKFTLGIAGVFICICSVLVSVGIFSLAGVKTSLIIAEVIPFLVLAVGVDNIFILVNQFERYEKTTPVDERIAETMSEVGPSITLSACAETVAFALGAVVSMPAVNSFAAYSAVAIFVDFLLQITCFVSLLGLDAHRAESRRLDCLPCVPINTDAKPAGVHEQGFLQRFVAKYYAPALLHPVVKPVVMVFFSLLLITGISLTPYLQLGLDQSIALPQDSYLIPYFVDQASLLKVGAPVYFVIQGGNITQLSTQEQMCAGFVECNDYSVPSTIVLESTRPDYSSIALRPSLWLDDFINWMDPGSPRCCRINTVTGEYCQADSINPNCRSCYTREEYANLTLAPQGPEFMERLEFWLQAIPGENCIRAGAGAYADALLPNYETNLVEAAHFRTYHTVIQTQAEYIYAYEAALRVCDQVMEQNEGISCFPYTIFYVYFEQYLNIVAVMVLVLALAAVAVFLVTWLVIGSAGSAAVVVGVVLMIVVDMVGVMAVWQISLNAVSLVNLVMALGISVEFCSHLTRAFTITAGTRQSRATFALVDVGASVFSGITMTKFAGVVVLAFAQSEIFVVYYFRMYLSTVVLGFLHGLVFLPVLLSYFGPSSTGAKSADESLDQLTGVDKEARKLSQRKSIYGSA